MKYLAFLIVLQFSTISFAEIKDNQTTIDTLVRHLDYGGYQGKDCEVAVTSGQFPPGVLIIAPYMLEILSKGDQGWYAFSTNHVTGGKGDCADILTDEQDHLKVKNSGPYAPCFSNYKKSNPKGLEIRRLNSKHLKVTTLDKDGQPELSCIIRN